MEAREGPEFDFDAARRDRRRQQSRVTAQCSARRPQPRSRCVARAEETYDFDAERCRLGRCEHHHRRERRPADSAETQSRKGASDRRIPLEQNRPMIRILKLDATTEKQLLRARQFRDIEAERVATKIIADVRKRGDAALFAWTKKLDRLSLNSKTTYIPCRVAALRPSLPGRNEFTSPRFLDAVKHAAKNVRAVAEKQLPRTWSLTVEPGVKIRQSVSPIDTIGCYIPGGRHALVSTLVMTVVPAQVAGVKNIVVVCPHPDAKLLAAANLLGIEKIAQIGGAQSIAALAYGTQSIPRVEKIFGPGNRYVTA